MKKALLLTAIASVALVGCVNDEVANPANQGKAKIAFDSPVMYGNENSRANIFGEISNETVLGNYSYPKEESFRIYAVEHEGDLTSWDAATAAEFDGDSIKYDNSVDGWAPKTADGEYYFWSDGIKMSFAAMSPATLEQANNADWTDDNVSYGSTGLIIKDFEVNADTERHFDLMFSAREVNKTSADMLHSASTYSGIPIKFQHALASIRFSCKNTSDEDVVLTKIELAGVKYKGTFNENINNETTEYVRGESVNPAWTVEDELIANPYLAFDGSIVFPYEAQYLSHLVENEGNDGDVNQLLVMPQELTDEVVATIYYTVNGKENTKVVTLNNGLSGGDDVVNKTPITEWEMGKRYTYRLFYSSESAAKDKIYFSPSSDSWEEVDVIIIEL